MNCLQIDKILYLFCEGRLQPHLRSQIEEHLKDCPSCQHNYLMTAMETEALRETKDIPPLSNDFCQKVMSRVAERGTQISYGSKTARKRLINLFNLFDPRLASGMLAIVVLLFLISKWSLPPGSQSDRGALSVKQPKTVSTPLKIGNSTQDTGSSACMLQQQPHTDEVAAESSATRPRLSVSSEYGQSLKDAYTGNRGSVSAGPTKSQTVFSSDFTVVRPHYVPAGYSLVEARSEVTGDLSLIYSDKTGSRVHVFICPIGGEKEAPYPAQSPNASFSAAADSEAGVRTRTAGDSNEQEQPVDDAEKKNDCLSTVTHTLDIAGQSYRVEVSGSLPLEELAHIADSCQ